MEMVILHGRTYTVAWGVICAYTGHSAYIKPMESTHDSIIQCNSSLSLIKYLIFQFLLRFLFFVLISTVNYMFFILYNIYIFFL